MTDVTNVLPALYEDDVVRFIAGRYHVTPQELVERFLADSSSAVPCCLEENEKEILWGLMELYSSKEKLDKK